MTEKTIEEKIAMKQKEIDTLDKKSKEIAKKKKQKKEEIKLLKHDYFMDILDKNDIDSSTKLLNIIQESKEMKSSNNSVRHSSGHRALSSDESDRKERRERHSTIRHSIDHVGGIEGI